MYLELVNDTVYTVTYQEKTLEFKASVGEVAQVVIIGTDTTAVSLLPSTFTTSSLSEVIRIKSVITLV